MFSSFGSSVLPGAQYFNGSSNKGQSANAAQAIPRAFKAPTLAANSSYAASATLDIGYIPMPSSESRQGRSTGYFQAQDANRVSVDTRDYSKRSPPQSSSAAAPQEPFRSSRPRTSSFAITPSSSQRAFVYERSITSKTDLHADSEDDEDEEDEIESPISASSDSSVTTNLSTAVLPEPATASRSRIEVLSNMPSIPVGHIVPPSFDLSPGVAAGSSPPRTNTSNSPPSTSTNQAPRRQLPTPPRSNSSGSNSSSSTVSSGQGQDSKAVRTRLMSNAAVSRDSAIYPLKSGYSGPLGTGPVGPRMANEVSRQENLEEQQQVAGPGSYISQPPGLETYLNDPNRPPGFVPHRRNSDGDQTILLPNFSSNPAVIPQIRSMSAPPSRNVRWKENLICPSPILSSQRRKGYFNRRGDQLWTNDGAYRPPPEGDEYPLDLDDYPEYGEAWQDERGVRIDMRHRLIPKQPMRSALKKPRSR
ncbi:hypothetical protein FIBSPDRAFT_103385 [Athelia psychrophila]|uniref:Uncharacterized protein n=1 Tax=Athelia psychrophila TaxID=1759441 RepID=A0A166DGA3_9AGAM|nr:hypothetical protein FIBSPDRAFT_103385 [Fibularhizoctonia sp. CBS 109695]